jgi:hypothetical protein
MLNFDSDEWHADETVWVSLITPQGFLSSLCPNECCKRLRNDYISNNLISMFIFFYNFVRPHSSLNGLTPAQVAGLSLTTKEKRKFLLVA